MNKHISKLFQFSPDEFYGVQSQKKSSNRSFPINKNNNSFEVSELGPCMNPDGFVSNIDCPKKDEFSSGPEDLLCNCPNKQFMPKGICHGREITLPEPTNEELLALRAKTNECYLIDLVLDKKRWFGVDYSNQYCSYNCFNDLSPGTGSTSIAYQEMLSMELAPGAPDPDKHFPYAARKAYSIDLPKSKKTCRVDGFTSGITFPHNPEILTGLTLTNFKDYMAYSKTNATFWRTPKETPLYRRAQTNLLTYQRVKIVVNGDFSIKPGNLLSLNIPTGESKTLEFTRFHGQWMVYAVDRVITSQKHSMILYLMRDGNYISPETNINPINTNKEPGY